MNAPARIPRDQLGQFLGKWTKQDAKRRRIEEQTQKTFANWCKLCLPADVLWFSIPNERKPSEMGALLAMGLRPGAADFCIIYRGKAHFIEFKAPDGYQSDAQKRFEEDCERAWATYTVCKSSKAATDHITVLGIPHSEVTR